MISARQLKDRITIKQRILAQDGAGGQTVTYHEISDVPCYIKPMRTGNRDTIAERISTPTSYQLIIRGGITVQVGDICTQSARSFEVNFVHEHPENQEYVVLICQQSN